MLPATYVDELVAVGRGAGLDLVGVASADPFDRAREAIEARKEAGLHGGMQFTFRNPARSTDPRRTLPSARSLVVAARSYPAAPPSAAAQQARVAWYATTDHYGALRIGLDRIAERLRADGYEAVVLADDNALVDRAAAHRAGLGWFGKNANLLMPGRGSWFVLGSVVTDAALPGNEEPVADGCGGCTRCVDGCPTGAIVAPGVIDANRCLAWLVQAEGSFPAEHRVALGDRLYGCDECQLVCPINRRAGGANPSGVGDAGDADDPGAIDVLAVLRATDDELLASYGRWYIPRREVRYLRRNALIVLGNTGDADHPDVVEAVRRGLTDPDELIVSHAVWAARRLGLTELITTSGADRDPSDAILEELGAPVEVRV